jgi:hypothetical protein
MGSLHWRHLVAKLSATVTHDFTCLGHLGQHDGQGKYIRHNIVGLIVGDIALNLINVIGLIVPHWPRWAGQASVVTHCHTCSFAGNFDNVNVP